MRATLYQLSGAAAGLLLLTSGVVADTPALVGPHGHGKQVTGNITMFRAQEKGLEAKTDGKKIDAEILVQIDAQPNMVFILPFHEQDPARQQMVETLRQAYVNDKPVTIEHVIAPGQKTAKINWVQFGKLILDDQQ